MQKSDKYGEVKAKKYLSPQEAKKIAEKGFVGLLLAQARLSDKTKSILDEAGIRYYDGLSPERVAEIRGRVKAEEASENGFITLRRRKKHA